MREAEVWRNGSEAEFDNAMEGMEKLVMNRLYELYVRFPLLLWSQSYTIPPVLLRHRSPVPSLQDL